jgi:hypothetical protein
MNEERPTGFEPWVPAAARYMIDRMRTAAPEYQDLLTRLSEYPAMRSVWAQLPGSAQGKEDEVIYWTAYYAMAASNFVPPPLGGKKALVQTQISTSRALSDLSSVSGIADLLLLAMADTESDARYLNQASDKTFDDMYEQVSVIRDKYRGMSEIKAEFIRYANVHMPRKRGSKQARQLIFTVSLSSMFQKLFGRPLDEITATLSGVVFDLDDAPGGSTVRGRRRRAHRHIADKKSR